MPININYTAIDYDALRNELIQYLRETKTYKDVDFAQSNISNWVDLEAYLGSLFGYYANSVANEVFLPSAKRWKNLNRIARLLAYNPRGDVAATLSAVGSLSPEYCFGKENAFFEIPAYSQFPSQKATPSNQNFVFTNTNQILYLIKGYGTRTVTQNDFAYDGNQLPLTKPVSFWTSGTSGASATPTFDPQKISLTLSDTKPLSVLDRLDPTNFKGFDTNNVPMFDPSDASSVGQPFNRTITTNPVSFSVVPSTNYFVLFNYDKQTSKPSLSVIADPDSAQQRQDDIITTLQLKPTDSSGDFYVLEEVQNNSLGRFYVGVLGMENLDSVQFSYDKLESTANGIKQIHLIINQDGDKPPFNALVEGQVYSFYSGEVSSQVFDVNTWDVTQPVFNINLQIVTPDSPGTNYDAVLNVTSKEPGYNEVTIAKIYPNYVDPDTDIKALSKDPGQRFGNFQVIPKIDYTTTEQKSGYVKFVDGINSVYVSFDTPFTTSAPNEVIEYILELTPDQNVQIWFSSKSEKGFTINVEANTGFDGNVNWIATRFKEDAVRTFDVSFDTEIPEIAGEPVDYTVFLTPSDNVRVWYTDKTSKGFKVNTERSFTGTVSYSTFVFSGDQAVQDEATTSTQKKGTVTLSGDVVTRQITFDTAFQDANYGLHIVTNQNINSWYTDKTNTGFTLNIETGFEGQVVADWFADFSSEYIYQKHGTINFAGQISNDGTLPGIRYSNVPETFSIDSLRQGDIKLSYINQNGAIDVANNYLSAAFTADRTSINEIKFYLDLDDVSYSDLRIFLKDPDGDWEEWDNASNLAATIDTKPGSKVFFVRVNEYKKIEIWFGDGVTYGTDPVGKEIIIFGLRTVGIDGNIPPNTLSDTIVISENILGDDDITINFEDQFIQLVGLKKDAYFASGAQIQVGTIYDSEGTQITEEILSIQQPTNAFSGANIETVEELRANAGSANLRQDRVVSLDDYASFCNQMFSDYLIKTQVLSYKEIAESGFISADELTKYFFNYIFIIGLPRYGNYLTKQQTDWMLDTLNNNFKAMATVEHQIFTAKYVPIDVRVRFKKLKNASGESIKTAINKAINDYFLADSHELGETLHYGELEKTILNLAGVQTAQIAMNRNIGLSTSDYVTDAVVTGVETVQQVKRKKVLELLAKDPSLFTIIEPLFDIRNPTTNVKEFQFTGDIVLSRFEFPTKGNIIIELEA